ncbi:hypothetical protein SLEP1_g24538 [Rubroshorea leprosula]|uniref:Uncharacterized protein n=1 Tax=Rubroshorea leprosula TaxID=152421 RepID=A0AAV5JJ50_9ROSI|nr:hypothetical protein SLEP1_g24538 [Rubroshorea leprosula]
MFVEFHGSELEWMFTCFLCSVLLDGRTENPDHFCFCPDFILEVRVEARLTRGSDELDG